LIVPGTLHEAALAAGKLTRVLNRRSADPSEVIMSRHLFKWFMKMGISYSETLVI
jgi:hypothetical protein